MSKGFGKQETCHPWASAALTEGPVENFYTISSYKSFQPGLKDSINASLSALLKCFIRFSLVIASVMD